MLHTRPWGESAMSATLEDSEAGDCGRQVTRAGVPASERWGQKRWRVGCRWGDLVGDMVQPTSEAIRVLAGSEWVFVLWVPRMIFGRQRGWIFSWESWWTRFLSAQSPVRSRAAGAVVPREAVRGRWRGERQDSIQSFQFSSGVQSCLFATPWTAARQASLSITKSVLWVLLFNCIWKSASCGRWVLTNDESARPATEASGAPWCRPRSPDSVCRLHWRHSTVWTPLWASSAPSCVVVFPCEHIFSQVLRSPRSFVCSSVDGHLGDFWFGPLWINNAAGNLSRMFQWTHIYALLLGVHLWMGLLGYKLYAFFSVSGYWLPHPFQGGWADLHSGSSCTGCSLSFPC